MPYLWTQRKQPTFFSKAVVHAPKQVPSINPHPDIIEKFMDGGKLINNNPKSKQEPIQEKEKKKKKKRLPGEKLLKKLAKHKDSDEESKKLKRIIYAIKSNINKVYNVEESPFE